MNENNKDNEQNKNNNNQIANEQVEHTFYVTKIIYVQDIMKRNNEIINKRQRFRKVSKS